LRCPDLGHCGAPDSSDGHVVLHCQDLSWCLRSSSLLFSLPSLRQRGSTVDKRWRAGRCRVAGDGAVPPSPRPPPCPLHLGSAMALNFGRWAPAAARLPTPAATSPTPSTRARKAKHSPASWSSARRQGAQRGKFSFFFLWGRRVRRAGKVHTGAKKFIFDRNALQIAYLYGSSTLHG
jgi:hypothetical protein